MTMNNPILVEIEKQINRATDIALFSHTNPDCDTLSSMLALYVALKNKGKNVTAYCDCTVPERLKCLYASENVIFPQKHVHELAISLDASALDRLGQSMKCYLSAKKQIAIDHHKSFTRFASLCYVDDSACACTEIVYQLLKNMKLMDDNIAKLLFSGLVTDSGCFAYSNVTERTHEIACELLKYNFDAGQTIYDVFNSKNIERFMLENRVLAKTKFYSDGQIAIASVFEDDLTKTGASIDDTIGVINGIMDVDGVKVAYALLQVGQRNFKLSIRTKGNIDASEIAMTFGGGGHKNASGCRVNGYYEDIVERLLKLANDRI